MLSFYIKPILLLNMMLIATMAYADDVVHIGSATTVVNEVFTSTNTGEVRINLNDALFFKQQVITKENSNLTVTFRDNSTFAVAPQSQVTLDEFVFNPSENVLEKTINVIKGSFRYISGFPIKGSSTKIITPFGTAGIRGSAVQGTISSQSGLTLNVGSGFVEFQSTDGQTSTINEGESLTISPQCNTVPNVPMSVVANTMSYIENTITTAPNAALTPQQQLVNATLNTMSVAEQRRAYASAQASTVKPASTVNGKTNEPVLGRLSKNDPQELINQLINKLQNQNKQQVDVAVQGIIGAMVASGLESETIAQIAINGLSGAKTDHQLHIASTMLNTLQKLNPTIAASIAGKLQQALPNDQQQELPMLVPDVKFPVSAPSNRSKLLVR